MELQETSKEKKLGSIVGIVMGTPSSRNKKDFSSFKEVFWGVSGYIQKKTTNKINKHPLVGLGSLVNCFQVYFKGIDSTVRQQFMLLGWAVQTLLNEKQ